MKINLDDPKTTLRLDPKWKRKAYEIASKRNMSLNQYIEFLIESAPETEGQPTVREQLADLQRKTADLDARLHDLQKKPSKK